MHERFQCSVVTNVCMHVEVFTLTYMLTQMPREVKSSIRSLGVRVTEGYTGAGTGTWVLWKEQYALSWSGISLFAFDLNLVIQAFFDLLMLSRFSKP